MSSLRKLGGELSNAAKSLGGILCERSQHHALHGWRHRSLPLDRRGRGVHMLARQFYKGA